MPRMSFSRAWIDRWAPRRSFLSVSSANQRSTWLSQEEKGGCEVHVERGMSVERFCDFRGLMVAQSSQIRCIELGRNLLVQRGQKLPNSRRGVGDGSSRSLAGCHVQRSEQGGDAVAEVVMSALLGSPGIIGSTAPIGPGLDLPLHVHAEHERLLRRIEIQTR